MRALESAAAWGWIQHDAEPRRPLARVVPGSGAPPPWRAGARAHVSHNGEQSRQSHRLWDYDQPGDRGGRGSKSEKGVGPFLKKGHDPFQSSATAGRRPGIRKQGLRLHRVGFQLFRSCSIHAQVVRVAACVGSHTSVRVGGVTTCRGAWRGRREAELVGVRGTRRVLWIALLEVILTSEKQSVPAAEAGVRSATARARADRRRRRAGE